MLQFNRNSGLAEIVVPRRSKLIGKMAFPGMAARDGDLVVLAVHRGHNELGPQPTAGDHILLQGTWKALDKHLADPKMLVVDSHELVRRQTVRLGLGLTEALIVLGVLVVLLATGWVPGAVAARVCAVALVLLGVLTVPQAYKGIDWTTCFLFAGMLPLATAMTHTGAAQLIADWLIHIVGMAGPRGLLIGLFLVTLAIISVMNNTANRTPDVPDRYCHGERDESLGHAVHDRCRNWLTPRVAHPGRDSREPDGVGARWIQVPGLYEIPTADRTLVACRHGLRRAALLEVLSTRSISHTRFSRAW